MRLKPTESAVRAGHLQHLLSRRFDRPARPAVSWELRVKAQQALSEVSPKVLAAFLQARAAAVDSAAAASLESLAREVQPAGNDETSAAQILDTLAEGPVSKHLADGVRAIVDGGAYARLEPRSRKRVLAEIDRARHSPASLGVIIALLRSEGLFELTLKERIELFGYLLGPTASAPRQPMIQSAWTSERDTLEQLLFSPTFKKANRVAQAEMLRDFLYYPSQDVYFLEAKVYGGRGIVCFGAPSESPALSYGLISKLSLGGPFGSRIESPDLCVASGFIAPIRDTLLMYSYHRVRLSREEVRRTVEWIETTHEIGAEAGQGAIAKVLAAHRFITNCFRFVSNFSGGRETEQGLMHEGRPCNAIHTDTDQYAQKLLNEFLAA